MSPSVGLRTGTGASDPWVKSPLHHFLISNGLGELLTSLSPFLRLQNRIMLLGLF